MNAEMAAAQQIITPETKEVVNTLVQAGVAVIALFVLLLFGVVALMLLRFLGNRGKSDDKQTDALIGMVHDNREYRKETLEATKIQTASIDRSTEATETLIRTIKTNEAHSDGKFDGLNTNMLLLINEVGSVKDTMSLLADLTKNNPSEHAIVIKAIEALAAQINTLVDLLRPPAPAPDITPEANNGDGGDLKLTA